MHATVVRRAPIAIGALAALALAACSDATRAADPEGGADAAAVGVAAGYTVVDIGPGFGEDVNGRGTVLVNGTDGVAYLWSAGGGAQPIGAFTAAAINARGVVVGSMTMTDGASVGARWTAANGLESIGSLAADPQTYTTFALDVNEHGEVTGWTPVPPSDCLRVFRWTESGGMTAISDGRSGTCEEFGIAIDDWGRIAGTFGNPDEAAFDVWAWSGTDWTRLTLGSTRGSYAADINNRGDITGFLTRDGLLDGPFVWRPFKNGSLTTLRKPLGPDADARGINDTGALVGYDFAAGTGWLRTPWGKVVALPEGIPNAINKDGVIVGTSFASGSARAVLWVPATGAAAKVPAPLASIAPAAGGHTVRAASVRECAVDGRIVPLPCAAVRAR